MAARGDGPAKNRRFAGRSQNADVGNETVTSVSPDYDAESSHLTGTTAWVQIDLGDDAPDVDHLIRQDERLRIAMARQ
jgi:hypothetical protein